MLSLKMLEYTSLGLPVITIRNEAISHYFDKEDSFFYDPLDLSSLSGIFGSMHSDPQIIMDNRARILEKREELLWKSQAGKYVRLINQTIK